MFSRKIGITLESHCDALDRFLKCLHTRFSFILFLFLFFWISRQLIRYVNENFIYIRFNFTHHTLYIYIHTQTHVRTHTQYTLCATRLRTDLFYLFFRALLSRFFFFFFFFSHQNHKVRFFSSDCFYRLNIDILDVT